MVLLFSRFEECKFYLPEDEGVRITTKVSMAEHLRIGVHFGPREEMIAMASINMDDLDGLVSEMYMASQGWRIDVDTWKNYRQRFYFTYSLISISVRLIHTNIFQDLPVVFLPAPVGDEFIARKDGDSTDDETDETESTTTEKIKNQQLEGIDPVGFPLYSLHVERSADAQKPAGSLPLVCYWVKRLKPRVFNRITGVPSANDIMTF